MIGAVDINKALERIATGTGVEPGLQAAQPENAGGDQIGLGGPGVGPVGIVEPCGLAGDEDRAMRCAVAIAFGDAMQADGSALAVLDAGNRFE